MDDFMNYVNIATAVVAAASAIANLTPTDKDDKAVSWVSSLVHALALNWRTTAK